MFSGILYAEDFDAPELQAVSAPVALPAEPVVIEPTFSLTEMRRAADHAQREGRALERQDVERSAATRQVEALERIAELLDQVRRDADRVAAESAAATAHAVLSTVAAVLPAFCAEHGERELGTLLRLLLPAMAHEPRLSIRVHPSLIDGLKSETATLFEDGETIVDWVGSAAAQPGDISVRWNNGSMTRDVGALCAEIRAVVMAGLIDIDQPLETNNGS